MPTHPDNLNAKTLRAQGAKSSANESENELSRLLCHQRTSRHTVAVSGFAANRFLTDRVLCPESTFVGPRPGSFPIGATERSFAMIAGRCFTSCATSSSVLWRPRLRRTDPRARSGRTPMAVRTWEGSSEPVVQADPLEAQM